MMAVWTPGSYLVREYERHVEGVTATAADGRALAPVKPAKNRWRVETGGARSITVSYRVYGREMTVRTNWVESGFAMLNGAPTFITLADRTPRPHEVRVELPAAWKGSATALLPIAGQPHAYRAEDFDTLVDSPIVLGNPVVRSFDVAGKAHHLVLEGDPSLLRRRSRRRRPAADRRGRRGSDGPVRVPALLLPQHGGGSQRRPRAQELVPHHVEPLRRPATAGPTSTG